MMDTLNELNINNIKDFLMATESDKSQDNLNKDQQFKKQHCVPPPQYHLESSRGDIKDCLTAFQLQSYFGS